MANVTLQIVRKLRILRWEDHPGLLKWATRVLRGRQEARIVGGESHVTMKADFGVTQPPAKQYQHTLEARRIKD